MIKKKHLDSINSSIRALCAERDDLIHRKEDYSYRYPELDVTEFEQAIVQRKVNIDAVVSLAEVIFGKDWHTNPVFRELPEITDYPISSEYPRKEASND